MKIFTWSHKHDDKIINAIKNLLSDFFFILITLFYISHNYYYKNFFTATHSFPSFSFTSFDVFLLVFFLYVLVLFFFRFSQDREKKSKSRLAITALYKILLGINRVFDFKISEAEKVATLSILVKMFFLPLMLHWFFATLSDLVEYFNYYLEYHDDKHLTFLDKFNFYIFWLIFNLIILIDISFFMLGYLLEFSFLKNTIKSVEPTALGWLVCIICYPPFNDIGSNFFNWYSKDFPYFTNNYLHYAFSSLLLIFFAIYAWASVALGLRASNLTNRGIVDSGPYRFIRHPAYFCKNMAWWIGALPFLSQSFLNIFATEDLVYENILLFFSALFSLSAWTFIYYLRAITEERHLGQDKNYQKYSKRVPYRFIPGII